MVLATAQVHSTKSELRFCVGSNPTRGVSEIRDGEDLWQWSWLEVRLNVFHPSTVPQKQFIIIIKARFRIHKRDIKTNKERCGTARYFNTKCSDIKNPHTFLQVQLTELVVSDLDLENKLWEREKYWHCQLFTNTHGMNSVSDLYANKRKEYRENNVIFFIMLFLVVQYHYCFML